MSWLQKVVTGLSVNERRSLVEQAGEAFPLTTQARLLGMHRNHIWGIDITYIRLRGGWLYPSASSWQALVAVLDWYSCYVVSWQLNDPLEMPFVLTAVDQALAQTSPDIWNSDQGSQFTSPQYTRRLLDAQVRISSVLSEAEGIDGRDRAMNNIFTERL